MSETSELTRGERTRQAILDAAEDLILGQGYHGTSMRQIADRAGIAVGGIYNHFSGKEALFSALLASHQPYTDIVAGLQDLAGESAAELVEGAARLIVKEGLEDPVFIRLSFIDLQEFGGDTLFHFAQQMIYSMLAFAQQLVATGQLREDVPLPVLVRSFAGLVIFFVLSEVVALGDEPPRVDLPLVREISREDWIARMVDVFLNGVLKKEEA